MPLRADKSPPLAGVLSNKLFGSNSLVYGNNYSTPAKKYESSQKKTILNRIIPSIRKVAIGLKSSAQTIKKYSNNLFKDKYYLTITDE